MGMGSYVSINKILCGVQFLQRLHRHGNEKCNQILNDFLVPFFARPRFLQIRHFEDGTDNTAPFPF